MPPCNGSNPLTFRSGPELLEDHSGFDPGDILQSVLETSLLGVQLKAETFCHAVIDRACQISRQEGLLFRVANINTIYAQTERSSSIRKWIVDEWVWQYDARTKDDDMSWEDHKHLSPEVLFDVSREQGKRLGWRAQVSTSSLRWPLMLTSCRPILSQRKRGRSIMSGLLADLRQKVLSS